jgi:tetratricopeptide (TPR) repeat protein
LRESAGRRAELFMPTISQRTGVFLKLTMRMPTIKTLRWMIVLLLVLFQANLCSFSQTKSYPYREWTRNLSSKDGPILSGFPEILHALLNKDSTESIAILNELERAGNSANKYFDFRFNFVKAVWARNIKGGTPRSMQPWIRKALNAAYETENDSLVSGLCWWNGYMMYWAGDIELASMHCLNAVEIDERIGRKISADNYGLLGEILYSTRDNEKSIYYTKKAIATETDTSYSTRRLIRNWLNTIGLSWKRIGNYDSAFFYFNSAFAMSRELNEPIWQSIISGNEGQVYYSLQKYALAKPLLESDYRFSKDYGELAPPRIHCNGLQGSTCSKGKKTVH